MTNHRELTTGRLGRLARLAGLGARTGLSLVASRGVEAAAAQAAEVLGSLRGLAAKAGQMASYIDGFVPEGQRAAYEAALSSLRRSAPTSSPEEIRALFESDLGAPTRELFEQFSEEPFASASIGQVHRARLRDGRDVAVKIQHPGIDRAVESDLENASVLRSVIGAALPRGTDTRRVFEEIRARFREELDYRLEAERQAAFAELFASDEAVRIPAVVASHSSRRVLTSELAHGETLEQAALRSEAERAAYARTLWHFVFKGVLVGRMFNADPHPGNYLFGEGGQITFLDFGCVELISEDRLAPARSMHVAAILRDEERFKDGVRRLLATRGGNYERVVLEYVRHTFTPMFESPFNITPEYVTSVVQGVRALKSQMLARDSSFVMPPPGLTMMNRLQFGFYSVLARLNVTVDYAAVEQALLQEAGVPIL
ncbi:MAG TPA: AarF/ABC1/UbiB kinase family protein [Polyangiaceae bacterium]|nr:AarF/ABC1/UbiB kinase family protein [Polyangiaceae bacterium]